MKASRVPRDEFSSSPLVSTGVAGVTPPGVVVDVDPLGALSEGDDELGALNGEGSLGGFCEVDDMPVVLSEGEDVPGTLKEGDNALETLSEGDELAVEDDVDGRDEAED